MIGSAMQIRLSLDGPWFVPHGSAAKSAACRGKGKEGRTKNMDAPDKIIAYYNNSNDEDLYLFMTLTNLIKADYGRRYIDPLIEELYD